MTFVVFSKDRPLQLDACLRSFARHCVDVNAARLRVLYKASDSRMRSYYRRLSVEHPSVRFVREFDFRRDLLVLLRDEAFIGFIVDDTIFVRDFSIVNIIDLLGRHPDALGYSLRLGVNTTYCYSLNRPQSPPEFARVSGHLKFNWSGAEHDFGYPLELSSSVYAGDRVYPLLEKLEYSHPNSLEAALAENAPSFVLEFPALLCAEKSLAFSAPANKVQEFCPNRAGANPAYTPEALASSYAGGRRIVVDAFDLFTPEACHAEVEFELAAFADPIPAVSVIIPCFQQAEFLPDAVNSVVGQTFSDWEIIVVNDGSPDNTSEIARRLIAQNPNRRIRLLEKQNGGLASARNAGIRLAQGAYVLPLDADDQVAPEHLLTTVNLLDAQPEVAIAYTDVVHFGLVNKTIQAAEFDFEKLLENNQLNYCSLFRREAWEDVGGYNANMIWGYEDWDFWIGCAELGFIPKRIPKALLLYRVRQQSMLAGAQARDAELRARIVLNHPRHYGPGLAAKAARVWSDPKMPLPLRAPKVSVIVPTHNRPDRLDETLRSVAAQTLQDFEIIIVNDNGVDVAPLAMGQEVVCARHPRNRGLAAARNTGLRLANAKYIAFLDDDDIFHPEHLETLVSALETSHARAAYADAECVEEQKVNGHYEVVRRGVQFSLDWDDERVLVQNFVPVQCFLHERSASIAAGPFDETLGTHEDWDYWIRLSRVCRPIHVRKVTSEYRQRVDGTNMTSRLKSDFIRTIRVIHARTRPYTLGNGPLRQRQREFLRGVLREYRKQNPSRLARWLRKIVKS